MLSAGLAFGMPDSSPPTAASDRLRFVYYCSGHGYGHATRVSAFARHLLSLEVKPYVHIVSSAPQHVFSDSIILGASYRYADIDPVIVQPLAYRVDRQKSVEVLQSFLAKKDAKVAEESQWLKNIGATCVLSDAAFLGCLAANKAGISSVLITNFSFDSVYSYLSTTLIDSPLSSNTLQAPSIEEEDFSDVPVPLDVLEPLVKQLVDGYRCADLLLRLPGAIPIPSFPITPRLPAHTWVNKISRSFTQDVVEHLITPPSDYVLHPPIPFPSSPRPKLISRSVIQAPLLVRPPHPSIYTPAGRRKLLESIGVPQYLHDPEYTKILIVSFGGQIFHKPHSRSHSRSGSDVGTPGCTHSHHHASGGPCTHVHAHPGHHRSGDLPADELFDALRAVKKTRTETETETETPASLELEGARKEVTVTPDRAQQRRRTVSALNIAGAPPASVPTTPVSAPLNSFSFALSTPPSSAREPLVVLAEAEDEDGEDDTEPQLLPDDSWIAIVCGVSKEWGTENGEELPDNFFVAPRDVYMPDLTAVADVLLGKLGYGTVSECVDSCTPFVFVPRPLFIEEHGLRLFLSQAGVGVELSRTSYEVGEWASSVEEAWLKGRDAKAQKRREGETGKSTAEGKAMARQVVDWVRKWDTATALSDLDGDHAL